MALQSSNTIADIYRGGSSPPAAPDVAAVPLFLTPDWVSAHVAAVQASVVARWTHVARLPPATDVRDHYAPDSAFADGFGADYDTLYIPDQNGVAYRVVFVTREGRGTAGDVKKVYLQRQQVSWPQDNV